MAQPTNYVSPSGVYALLVDPADRHGHGGAEYRLSKNGVEVWSGEKPYTLREVVVTDRGLAAGFAYRTGPKQDEPEGQPRPVGGPMRHDIPPPGPSAQVRFHVNTCVALQAADVLRAVNLLGTSDE